MPVLREEDGLAGFDGLVAGKAETETLDRVVVVGENLGGVSCADRVEEDLIHDAGLLFASFKVLFAVLVADLQPGAQCVFEGRVLAVDVHAAVVFL